MIYNIALIHASADGITHQSLVASYQLYKVVFIYFPAISLATTVYCTAAIGTKICLRYHNGAKAGLSAVVGLHGVLELLLETAMIYSIALALLVGMSMGFASGPIMNAYLYTEVLVICVAVRPLNSLVVHVLMHFRAGDMPHLDLY